MLGHERDLELGHHRAGSQHVEARPLGEAGDAPAVEVDGVRGSIADVHLAVLRVGPRGNEDQRDRQAKASHSVPRGWQL